MDQGSRSPGGGAGGRDEDFRRSPGSLSGVSGQVLGASQDCSDGEQCVDGGDTGIWAPDVSSLLTVITDLLQWVGLGRIGSDWVRLDNVVGGIRGVPPRSTAWVIRNL